MKHIDTQNEKVQPLCDSMKQQLQIDHNSNKNKMKVKHKLFVLILFP